MRISASRVAMLVVAVGVAVGPTVTLLSTAPAAYAQGIPNPGPVPVPELPVTGAQGPCQAGEALDPSTGNCLPAMTSVPASNGGDAPVPEAPPATTGDTTSTSYTGEPADLVPNINGDPCTGYWESPVCLADDAPGVQPHSTLSSSP